MKSLFIGLSMFVMCAGFTAAHADISKIPDPSKCTIPSHLDVVGANGNVPDPSGAWTVKVRDFANNPLMGTSIVIDFADCADIRIACDQLNAVTGQTNFMAKMVGATSGMTGQVTFYVQGAADAQMLAGLVATPGTRAGTPCAKVYGDGVLLGNLTVSANDVNGVGSPTAALTGADVALAANEMLKSMIGGEPMARDDFDGNGAVTGGDIAILAMRRLTGATLNTGNACP